MNITGTQSFQTNPANSDRVYKAGQNRTKGASADSFVDYQELHKARRDRPKVNCTAQGSNKVMLYSDALMSFASPQTGESVNIYRVDDYSAENPVYIIKGLDAGGNEFEEEVNAGQIDPDHCSYNELMVLNLETGQTSPGDYLHAVAIRDQSGADSYFEKKDYIACAQALMKDYQKLGDWASYWSMDKWIQNIINFVSKSSIDRVAEV